MTPEEMMRREIDAVSSGEGWIEEVSEQPLPQHALAAIERWRREAKEERCEEEGQESE